MIFTPGKFYGVISETPIFIHVGNAKIPLSSEEKFLCLEFHSFDGEQVRTECIALLAHFGVGHLVRIVDKVYGFDGFSIWRLIEEA